MTERRPEVDLSNMFFKGKPFINLVIASLLFGSVLGIMGIMAGGLLGYLIVGGITAAVCVPLILGAQRMFGSGKESEKKPQERRCTSMDYSQEPERKTGRELMERGNQAAAPGRGR